jgi:hypothetical protein
MRATVMFNGSLYEGEVIRETPKRMLVKFTTGSDWTREGWFTKVTKPEGKLVSRRNVTWQRDERGLLTRDGKGDFLTTGGVVTLPANSGFIEG